jgi:hypothetical protein
MIEEILELATARSSADALDAMYDLLGIIGVAMSYYDAEQIYEAAEAYHKSQESRGRKRAAWQNAAELFGAEMGIALTDVKSREQLTIHAKMATMGYRKKRNLKKLDDDEGVRMPDLLPSRQKKDEPKYSKHMRRAIGFVKNGDRHLFQSQTLADATAFALPEVYAKHLHKASKSAHADQVALNLDERIEVTISLWRARGKSYTAERAATMLARGFSEELDKDKEANDYLVAEILDRLESYVNGTVTRTSEEVPDNLEG